MASRRITLRSSQLLMWSSPLLLLVLVFTLNSRPLHPVDSPTPTTSHPAGSRAPGTASRTTSTTSSTTPTAVTTTMAPRVLRQQSTTSEGGTSSSPTTTNAAHVTGTTTTLAAPPRSVDSTTTSVAVTVRDATANVAGQLTLTDPAAIVPLRGPGDWTLAVDHAVAASLLCGSRSDAVSLAVRITSNQRCLLDINIATGAPTTWILKATP